MIRHRRQAVAVGASILSAVSLYIFNVSVYKRRVWCTPRTRFLEGWLPSRFRMNYERTLVLQHFAIGALVKNVKPRRLLASRNKHV
jgi:hypothetical protein